MFSFIRSMSSTYLTRDKMEQMLGLPSGSAGFGVFVCSHTCIAQSAGVMMVVGLGKPGAASRAGL